MTSTPATNAWRAASWVVEAVWCSTVAPPVAAASVMTNPRKPHAFRSVSVRS